MILIFQLEISRLVCICWHKFFNRYTYFCVSYIIVISERIRQLPFKHDNNIHIEVQNKLTAFQSVIQWGVIAVGKLKVYVLI